VHALPSIRDDYLEQRRECSRLGLDARRDECLPAVREHNHATRLNVPRRLLEESEVVAAGPRCASD